MNIPIANDTFQHEVVNHLGTVLVDFFTDGCGPCRMMSPLLDEISRERTDIKVVKVDAAADQDLASKFRVAAVPTFVLLPTVNRKHSSQAPAPKKISSRGLIPIFKPH